MGLIEGCNHNTAKKAVENRIACISVLSSVQHSLPNPLSPPSICLFSGSSLTPFCWNLFSSNQEFLPRLTLLLQQSSSFNSLPPFPPQVPPPKHSDSHLPCLWHQDKKKISVILLHREIFMPSNLKSPNECLSFGFLQTIHLNVSQLVTSQLFLPTTDRAEGYWFSCSSGWCTPLSQIPCIVGQSVVQSPSSLKIGYLYIPQTISWADVAFEAVFFSLHFILSSPFPSLQLLSACELSCFSHVQFFATLWILVCQASLSMGFSRQVYWSGFSCLPPGDLPDPGIKPVSLVSLHWQADSLSLALPEKPHLLSIRKLKNTYR